MSRHELIDVLWPERSPKSPEAGLSSALARLRAALGSDVLTGRGHITLKLDAGADVDVEVAARRAEEAERELAAQRSQRAWLLAGEGLAVASRPLLPGLSGPWVDDARADMAEVERRLLEARAEAGLALGGAELADAERATRALTERNPFSESACALRMRVQASKGDLADASRTYHGLRTLLAEELGTTPSRGLADLHDRLMGFVGEDPAPRASAPAPCKQPPLSAISFTGDLVFVGRRNALTRLRAAYASAIGTGRLVLVAGDAGVGKTSLAARLAEDVHAERSPVLYGRCDEEPIVPYQPLVEILRHGLGHLGRPEDIEPAAIASLLPELDRAAGGRGDQPAESELRRYALFEAVARLFVQWASTAPLLIVIDDLHWADRPTLKLLRHVLRRIGPAPVALLATIREADAVRAPAPRDLMVDLRREHRLLRVPLGGMDESETEALVAARLDEPATPEFVGALHARTEGNPFFIVETLRAVSEMLAEKEIPLSERALEGMGVPQGVTEVVVRRLERMSPRTQEVLATASAVGRNFGLDVVAAALPGAPSVDDTLEALEEAAVSGLILECAEPADTWAFSHAIVRAAVYERLSAGRRMRLHSRIGEALERMASTGATGGQYGSPTVPPAELAHHFFLAAPVAGRERFVEHAVAAGRWAARAFAYEDAELHLRRAADALETLGPQHEARRCDVLLRLGRVLSRMGASRSGRELFREVAASARVRRAPRHLALAALGVGERYWEANALDAEYGRLLSEAEAELGEGDSILRARILSRQAEHLAFTEAASHSDDLSREAVAMARRLGEPEVLIGALMARHVVLLDIAHVDERLQLADEILELRGGRHELSAEAHHWRLYDLCELGRVDQARDEHAELLDLSRRLRQPLFEFVAVAWQGVFAELSGDVDETEALALRSRELGRRAEAADATSVWAAKLFALRRRQGRLDELAPTVRELGGESSSYIGWQAALALLELTAGDPAAGHRLYERLVDHLDRLPHGFFWLTAVSLLAEACATCNDQARAARLYDALEPHAARSIQVSFASHWGSVERPLGLLARTLGRGDAALAHLGRALEIHEGLTSEPLRATTARDLATVTALR